MRRLVETFALVALSLVLSLAPAPAQPQPQPDPDRVLPALFDVVGVAETDVLNIRTGPGGDTEVIGTLPPHARNIEVVGTNDTHRWGMIAYQGQTGWVSMRFLRVQDGQDAEAFPRRLACSGSEPFWSIAFQPGGFVVLDRPDVGQELLRLDWTGISRNDFISAYGFTVSGATLSITGAVRRRLCSDGMSDVTYGFGIDAVVEEVGNRTLWSGCCSLQPVN